MTDFFTRLAEQTLGQAPVVKPLITKRFAPGRPLIGETSPDSSKEAEAESVEEGSHALSEKGTLTNSSSPGPTPVLVSKKGSSSEEAEVDSLEEGSHALSGKATLTNSPSPGPTPVLVSEKGSPSSTPTRPRTAISKRVVPGTEDPPEHRATSRSKKEDQRSVSSSSQGAAMIASLNEQQKGTMLDAVSTQRLRAVSDRKAPVEAMPSERTSRSEKLETFVPLTPLVRAKDMPAMEHSLGTPSGILQSSMTEAYRRSSLREARDHIALSEPSPSSPPPTIRVTIGRVEVRAIMPPAPPTRAKPARPAPTLSLEDYLKQRNEGKR